MNFWQQILLSQASSALHAIIGVFGAKYLTDAELAATGVVFDALVDLPRRIHEGKPPAPTVQQYSQGFEFPAVNLPVKRKSAK